MTNLFYKPLSHLYHELLPCQTK